MQGWLHFWVKCVYLWEIKACLKLCGNNVGYYKVEKGNITYNNSILIIVKGSQFIPSDCIVPKANDLQISKDQEVV